MRKMRNWILGAALVAGVMGLGTTTAQAAEYRDHARGPVAHYSHRAEPGYFRRAGYRADGYWAPGGWNYTGVRGRGYYGRGFDRRGDHYRGRGHYRR